MTAIEGKEGKVGVKMATAGSVIGPRSALIKPRVADLQAGPGAVTKRAKKGPNVVCSGLGLGGLV